MRSITVPFALAALAIAVGGCSNAPGSEASDSTDRAGSTPIKVGVALAGAPPIKVGVAIDKTGSSEPNGVAQVGMADFNVLLEVLKAKGGEIGVGSIRDISDRPLLRLKLEPPTSIDEQASSTNMYDKLERAAREKGVSRERDALVAAKINDFTEDLGAVLEQAPDAKKSAICEAVRRVDLFLSEDNSWAAPAKKYAVFITDGEENVERAPCDPMDPSVSVLIVRGGKPANAFAKMAAKSFENVSAAFAWVSAKQER